MGFRQVKSRIIFCAIFEALFVFRRLLLNFQKEKISRGKREVMTFFFFQMPTFLFILLYLDSSNCEILFFLFFPGFWLYNLCLLTLLRVFFFFLAMQVINLTAWKPITRIWWRENSMLGCLISVYI